MLLAPAGQAVAELGRQQDLAAFALAADGRLAAADSLRRDELQFRDANAGGADGLQQQLAALVADGAGCAQQTEILGAGEFPAGVGKDPALALEGLGFARRVVDGFLIVVDRSQQCIDGGGGVALGRQAVPPGGDGLAGGLLPCPGIGEKAGQGPGVLLDGGRAVLAVGQPVLIALYNFLIFYVMLLSVCVLVCRNCGFLYVSSKKPHTVSICTV